MRSDQRLSKSLYLACKCIGDTIIVILTFNLSKDESAEKDKDDVDDEKSDDPASASSEADFTDRRDVSRHSRNIRAHHFSLDDDRQKIRRCKSSL